MLVPCKIHTKATWDCIIGLNLIMEFILVTNDPDFNMHSNSFNDSVVTLIKLEGWPVWISIHLLLRHSFACL